MVKNVVQERQDNRQIYSYNHIIPTTQKSTRQTGYSMADPRFNSLHIPIWGSFIVVLFAILYFAKAVFIPLFLAILSTFLLNPVVDFINKKLWLPRAVGAGLVLFALLVAVALAANFLTEPATMWFKRLPVELRQTEMKLSFLKKSIENVQETTNKFGEIAAVDGEPDEKETVVVRGPNLFNRILDSTQSVLIGFISYIVLLYFLLTFSPTLIRDAGHLLQNRQQSLAIFRIAKESQARISYYLLVISLINLVLGCCITLVAWGTDLPNPMVWGVSGALLNYIPYFGPAVNIGIVALVSLLSFETISQILLPPLLILGLNIIEGQVVQPLTVGRVFTINPAVVFLSILLWSWLWGVAGIFMAVPILMISVVILEQVRRFKQETTSTLEKTEVPEPERDCS